MMCQGLHESSPKLPIIPGYEVSGEILELGSEAAKQLKVGSKIVGLNKDLFSGFAEECTLAFEVCYCSFVKCVVIQYGD
jgi:NADPH:quinone reductase-like Zn-dependent oxidoreductase